MTAAIRPRTDWEAVDLGLTLVQANARLVYTTWLAFALPTAFLCLAVAFAADRWWLANLLFWWLKPLLDRVPLHVLSRALFAQNDRFRDVLRQAPKAILTSGALTAITIGRIGLARSFKLPVWQLEGVRGKARRDRTRVLLYESRGTAAWSTLLCIALSTSLYLTLYAAMVFAAPDGFREGAGMWLSGELEGGPSAAYNVLAFALIVVAESVIEPIYVSSGFTLYLNRRTRLEAWDIELQFRRLAARHAARGRSRRRPAAATAACLVASAMLALPALLPSPAAAHEPESQSADQPVAPSVASEAIARVLAHPDFQAYESQKRWVPRSGREVSEADSEAPRWLEWFDKLGGAIAGAWELLVWLAVAVLVLAAWRYRHIWTRPGVPSPPARRAAPAHVEAAPEPPVAWPKDIPGEVRRLWAAGRTAAALSLLYRAALHRLVDAGGLHVPASATEADCLNTVRQHARDGRAEYFADVTRVWQRVAYAGSPPATGDVHALCARWAETFGDHS